MSPVFPRWRRLLQSVDDAGEQLAVGASRSGHVHAERTGGRNDARERNNEVQLWPTFEIGSAFCSRISDLGHPAGLKHRLQEMNTGPKLVGHLLSSKGKVFLWINN